jgi:hypothetical protein
MIDNGIEFTAAERDAIHSKLQQKLREILNKNLEEKREQRIELLAELYRLCLTRDGKLFLLSAENWRTRFLQKITEFEPLAISRANADYVAAADALRHLMIEINKGGLPACYQRYIQH